jgi:hypothetical protein
MKRATLVLLLALAGAAPAHAQSLFAARGLGLPAIPVDARARALGGIGVGLLGPNTSMVNPADLAGISRKGISAVLQPQTTDVTIGGRSDEVSGTRFPLIHAVLPVSSRLVFGLGYGGVYDQYFAVESHDTVFVGESLLPVRDEIRSSGGIGQARVSAAFAVTSGFAVGAAVGLYTGALERSVSRTFGDSAVNYGGFGTQIRWDYSGLVGVVGARWDPSPILRVAGAATFSGDIEAEGKQGDAIDRTFAQPLRLSFGASGLLGTELIATIGSEWSAGEDAPEPLQDAAEPVSAHGAWRLGGGLEWTGRQNAQRNFPVRLGGSYGTMPYRFSDEEQVSEWSVSGGIGLRLADAARQPYALADVSLERGGRSGFAAAGLPDGLEESFWRVTISLSLYGR